MVPILKNSGEYYTEIRSLRLEYLYGFLVTVVTKLHYAQLVFYPRGHGLLFAPVVGPVCAKTNRDLYCVFLPPVCDEHICSKHQKAIL